MSPDALIPKTRVAVAPGMSTLLKVWPSYWKPWNLPDASQYAHREARRINVPPCRLAGTWILEWDELPTIYEIAFPPIVHIGEQPHNQLPVRSRPVVHRHPLRYLFPAETGTGRAMHRAHSVGVVVAAQDGAVRKDPLRDRVDVVGMVHGTELPAVVQQEPVCGHVGRLDLRHIGADNVAAWSDPAGESRTRVRNVDRPKLTATQQEAVRPPAGVRVTADDFALRVDPEAFVEIAPGKSIVVNTSDRALQHQS